MMNLADENIKMLKAALVNAREAQNYLQKSCPFAAAANVKYIINVLQQVLDAEKDYDDLFDAVEPATTEINALSMNEIY